MPLSWRTKTQLKYLFLVILIILFFFGILGFVVYKKFFKPTCFDKKQNQNETGIDCGGECGPCAINLKEPIIMWSRFFKESENENKYDLAALIDNPNEEWGAKEIKYSFKIFDENNILIEERKGTTFLNPKERFIIFENSIDTKNANPKKVAIELKPIKNWKYIKEKMPEFIITKKKFDRGSSILETEFKSSSINSLKNIYISAILADSDGNAFAVSESKINYMKADETAEPIFTWQQIFENEPAQIEIMPRINMYDQN